MFFVFIKQLKSIKLKYKTGEKFDILVKENFKKN